MQGGGNMKNNSIFKAIKKPLSKNIGLFLLVSIALLMETGISLFIPNILSQVIDNLENKAEKWLFMCTLFFCFIVIMKGVIGIFKTYLRGKFEGILFITSNSRQLVQNII